MVVVWVVLFYPVLQSQLQFYFPNWTESPLNRSFRLKPQGTFCIELFSLGQVQMYTGWTFAHSHSAPPLSLTHSHTHICTADCLTFTFLRLDGLQSTAFKCKYNLRYHKGKKKKLTRFQFLVLQKGIHKHTKQKAADLSHKTIFINKKTFSLIKE